MHAELELGGDCQIKAVQDVLPSGDSSSQLWRNSASQASLRGAKGRAPAPLASRPSMTSIKLLPQAVLSSLLPACMLHLDTHSHAGVSSQACKHRLLLTRRIHESKPRA